MLWRHIACTAVLCGFLVASAFAADLKPFQKAALDQILATMEPTMRDMVRPQLEATIGSLNEEQVKAMLAGMADSGDDGDAAAEEATVEATAEDLAYNRAQYEPAIRKAWAAQKSFDDFVSAKLAAYCAKPGTYAVWGQAWRYEVYPLDPHWTRASESADIDVQIIGSSYPPQDGRYQFDFSQVRQSFDKAAVEGAVKDACAAYNQIGKNFVSVAKSKIANDMLPGGDRLQGDANGKVEPVRQKLESTLQQQSPNGSGALYSALTQPVRVQ